MQTQMQTMEASLSNELLEGEELVWSGRPAERGKSIASPARVLLIVGLIYGGIGLVFILVALILLLAVRDFLTDGAFWGVFVFGGFFFVIGMIMLIIQRFAQFAPKSTFYAITNRRVIILRGGRYLRCTSYDTRAINQVQRLERPDGSGDLIFSGISLAYQGAYGNSMYNAGRQGVFSAIPDVRLTERRLLGVMGKI